MAMRVTLLTLIALAACLGCVNKKEIRAAEKAVREQRWDEAYELWNGIYMLHPENTRAKLMTERMRTKAALEHLFKAETYFLRRQFKESLYEVSRVLNYDPGNQKAQSLNRRIQQYQDAERKAREESVDRVKPEADAWAHMPRLKPNSWGPLNLYFPKPREVRDIYTALGRAYGINIVVANDIRSEKIALDLRNLSFLKALDTLMVLNGHFFKIIDDNTIIILKDGKNNRERYENQIIRTFYLSNIATTELKGLITRLGGIKEVVENDKLNAITIKGTPEQISLAEKIIASNDKAQPEVVIEVELLEVNKSNMRRIGMVPVTPDFSGTPLYRAGVIASPRDRSNDDEDAGGIRGIFPSLREDDFLTILPAVAIDFLKENGDSKQVANPHLRVTSGEEAKVKIGQSIPVADTSFTNALISGSSSGTNNFGDQALTSFNYQDVGIMITVTPRVHFDNDVSLKLDLEVSSIISGGLQPTLGKRQVSTSLRLRNGETNVLAGLLTNDERKSLSGIPGLSDIPLLGKLFSNDEKIVSQTDIIMTIRPIVVRGHNIEPVDTEPYEVSSLTLSNLFGDQSRGTPNDPIDAGIPLPADDAENSDTVSDDGYRNPESRPQEDQDTYDQEVSETYEDHQDDHSVENPPSGGEGVEGNGGGSQPASTEKTEEPMTEELAEEPSPAVLAFTPGYGSARVDDPMEFQLFIANVEDLKNGQINLAFDPQLVHVDAVDLGDSFNAVGGAPLVTPAWNNDNGRLSLIISQRQKNDPFSGSGIVATIRMRAVGPGTGSLTMDGIALKNSAGAAIASEAIHAEYEVSQ